MWHAKESHMTVDPQEKHSVDHQEKPSVDRKKDPSEPFFQTLKIGVWSIVNRM